MSGLDGLVVRTQVLAPGSEPDLLAVAGADGYLFARDGVGVAGRGEATRIPWTGASGELAKLAEQPIHEGHESPGGGAIGFGALPFLPGAQAELVVPEVVVGRRANGAAWATTILPDRPGRSDGADGPDRSDGESRHQQLVASTLARTRLAPTTVPGAFEVRSVRSPDSWMEAVATAVTAIEAGRLDKVVLAREITVTADGPIPVATVLARLASSYPGCFLYSVDGYCGASPELLVSRSGEVVRAQPMAGTLPRSGDPGVDARRTAELLASPTYRHEHQVTIDAVHDALLAFSSYVDYEPEPSVVPLANVSHLATSVEGRLSQPPVSVLELVDALHPTPAVCGRPRDAALAVIAELEQLDRGRYAGAVGWVDAAGNGEWAVAIRGAMIDDNVARVIAGNGIVADANPQTELTETRAKLQAMLSAIVRP